MTYKKSLYFALVVGVILASIILFVGFQHNSQDEFYSSDNGKVDITYSVLIWITWFIPVASVVAAFGMVVTYFIKRKQK